MGQAAPLSDITTGSACAMMRLPNRGMRPTPAAAVVRRICPRPVGPGCSTASPRIDTYRVQPTMGDRVRCRQSGSQELGGGRTMIRVGIGGWTFEPWRGTFYPKGLKHAEELGYASR